MRHRIFRPLNSQAASIFTWLVASAALVLLACTDDDSSNDGGEHVDSPGTVNVEDLVG